MLSARPRSIYCDFRPRSQVRPQCHFAERHANPRPSCVSFVRRWFSQLRADADFHAPAFAPRLPESLRLTLTTRSIRSTASRKVTPRDNWINLMKLPPSPASRSCHRPAFCPVNWMPSELPDAPLTSAIFHSPRTRLPSKKKCWQKDSMLALTRWFSR